MAPPRHLVGRDQPLGTRLTESAAPIPCSGHSEVTLHPSRSAAEEDVRPKDTMYKYTVQAII
jgi:hypothetical protein